MKKLTLILILLIAISLSYGQPVLTGLMNPQIGDKFKVDYDAKEMSVCIQISPNPSNGHSRVVNNENIFRRLRYMISHET